MPTYEYRCAKCNRTFEEFQSMADKPLKKCQFDGCDGTVSRVISPGAGFLFKGSGFYETDYRSESYKKTAAAEKEKAKPKSDKKTGSDKKTTSTKKNDK